MRDQVKRYCSNCPYFTDVIYEGEQWYGARCKKDGHSTIPSMYAIKSLHNDCPLTAESENNKMEKYKITAEKIVADGLKYPVVARPYTDDMVVKEGFTKADMIEVLDKIRAEIEREYLAEGHASDYWDGIDKCLQIVDKYKAESEE